MTLPLSDRDALRQRLQADRWFATCQPDLQDLLLEAGRLRALGANAPLFERGARADGLACVLAGALRVGSVDATGTPTLLARLEPGQWFGEISLIDGLPRTHDAVADGAASVLVVPEAALRAFLDAHPAAWRDIGRLACAKLRLAFDVLEDIARLPLEARLARRLVLLSRAMGTHDAPPARELRLAQDQLALMMGVSRQTTNKALQALQARGWIARRYGVIELLDPAALGGAGGLS